MTQLALDILNVLRVGPQTVCELALRTKASRGAVLTEVYALRTRNLIESDAAVVLGERTFKARRWNITEQGKQKIEGRNMEAAAETDA